jgi:signal transduction histidine kinase
MLARRVLAATVVAALLLAVVVGAFVLAVLLLGRQPNVGERTVLALALLAATASALVWQLVHPRAKTVAHRLAYGRRGAPADVVDAFSARLTRAIPLDELLLQLAESLRAALGLEAAEVWAGSDGRLVRTASDPERGPGRLELTPEEEAVVVRTPVSGEAWAAAWLPSLLVDRPEAVLRIAPVAAGGSLLGLLVAERPRSGRTFDAEDDRVLGELARQVGLVLHSARLDSALQATLEEMRRQADELRASRARVVTAGDRERRRIERDLHDGAQQRLIALAVKARLARELAASDPESASTVLAELGSDIDRAIDELRALAHGIYPQDLVERGLRAALVAAARRMTPPARVDAALKQRYPAEIEAAVYFCCLEALQNAAKHAGNGARATISLREEPGALVFEVADDGVGFDPRNERGAGLAGMADRIGGIGGRLRVESTRGAGTRVVGAVPLYASSEER